MENHKTAVTITGIVVLAAIAALVGWLIKKG